MQWKGSPTAREIPVIREDELNIKQVRSLIGMRLNPSFINTETLLTDCCNMVNGSARKRGIRLVVDENRAICIIKADEQKLRQVIYNLLSNAMKFTFNGGKILLNTKIVDCIVRSGCREGDAEDLYFIERMNESAGNLNENSMKCLQLSVSDTGIGLEFEDLERIFDAFEQVRSSVNRNYQGTGLGLFLAKRLIELQGGMIWAESEGQGQGSTFSFIIPGRLTEQTATEEFTSGELQLSADQRAKNAWRELLEQTRKDSS